MGPEGLASFPGLALCASVGDHDVEEVCFRRGIGRVSEFLGHALKLSAIGGSKYLIGVGGGAVWGDSEGGQFDEHALGSVGCDRRLVALLVQCRSEAGGVSGESICTAEDDQVEEVAVVRVVEVIGGEYLADGGAAGVVGVGPHESAQEEGFGVEEEGRAELFCDAGVEVVGAGHCLTFPSLPCW